jgi:ring-1,2-phenylacetyl-CoA epoxidase subunit PaaE
MDSKTYDLVLKSKKMETADSCSLVFEVPAADRAAFDYKSGQFISLVFNIGGKDAVRSYSISSAPFENDLQVAVKRVKNGLVSNHIMDTLNTGDTVTVQPVDGRFVLEPVEHSKETLFFVAAGSGITPIFSMIKNCLENQPMSKLVLVYGNKKDDQVIFGKELEELEQKYKGQLFVYHAYSKAGGLFSRFKKSVWTADNKVSNGRVDASKLRGLLDLHKKTANSQVYLCGPEGLVDLSIETFSSLGFPSKSIHKELFFVSQDTSKGVASQLTVVHDGEETEIQLKAGENILDAMIKGGVDAPYSCRAGACSSCVAKVESGTVFMQEHAALDDDEVEDGYILCCQAQATSETLVIDMNK